MLGQKIEFKYNAWGSKHAYKNGRVYVADPALGNISFDEERFKEVWENNTLFLINVAPQHRQSTILAIVIPLK